jgi:Cof subfamily protein (haloacid dehalogenase superfamily)
MIAFDIDGTILDNNHSLSLELKDIVKHLIKKGYIVTLATARFPISAIIIAKELNLSADIGIVTLNGGFITNFNKEILYTKTFDWNINSSPDKLYDNVVINYYNGFEWLISKESFYIQMENNFINNIDYPKIGNLPLVNKITMMGDNEHLLQIKTHFINDDSHNYLLSFSHPNYLEVTTYDITKFTGLIHYATTLGINSSQIIAFGDGENDIPMLQNVGMGIAMGNASEHVKDSAYDVANSNANNGVFSYLDRLLKLNIL